MEVEVFNMDMETLLNKIDKELKELESKHSILLEKFKEYKDNSNMVLECNNVEKDLLLVLSDIGDLKACQELVETDLEEANSCYNDYLKELEVRKYSHVFPFDFFGNDDFILANKDKTFTAEEEVAIIVHSQTRILDDKKQALERIANETEDPKLKSGIYEWLRYQYDMLHEIQSIENKNIVFSAFYSFFEKYIPVFNTYNIYQTYKEASEDLATKVIRIDNVSENKQIGYIQLSHGDPISIKYNFDTDSHDLGLINYINNLQVSLNIPYKPLQAVYLPVYSNNVKVLADPNDKKVKELLKSNKEDPECNSKLWLILNIPYYYFDSANELKVGLLKTTSAALAHVRVVEDENQRRIIHKIKRVKK